VFLLTWLLALWTGLAFRGRVLQSVVLWAVGLALGFGVLVLPGGLDVLVSARATWAFLFGGAGFLSGFPFFCDPIPRDGPSPLIGEGRSIRPTSSGALLG